VKLALPTLLLVCAAPVRADVSIKLPPTWRDQCAERIDAAATGLGMRPAARRDAVPLLREDGSPNPIQFVEYGASGAGITVLVGNENEKRGDKPWTLTKRQDGGKPYVEWFRRAHGMFAKMTVAYEPLRKPFQAALDDCLKMGEPK
jgi:hypothetical protein